MKGTTTRRVDTQNFTNCFFVNGASDVPNPNGFFELEKCKNINIAACNFQGQGAFASGNKKTTYLVKATETYGLKLTGLIVDGLNDTALLLNNCGDVKVDDVDFIDANILTTSEIPFIRYTNCYRITVVNTTFASSNNNIYALSATDNGQLIFNNNFIYYDNANVAKFGNGDMLSGGYLRPSDKYTMSNVKFDRVNFQASSSLPDPASSVGQLVKFGGKLFYNLDGAWKEIQFVQ